MDTPHDLPTKAPWLPAGGPRSPHSGPSPPPPPLKPAYHPPSPPQSVGHHSGLPVLVRQVRAFLEQQSVKASPAFAGFGRFPNVSLGAYHAVSLLLDKLGCPARLDYLADRSLLIIRMPDAAHEILVSCCSALHASLFQQGFWWPQWGSNRCAVMLTGACRLPLGALGAVQPDAGLRLHRAEKPFLVVEVADTESWTHARAKAGRVLLRTEGVVRFVVIVKLVRKTARELKSERMRVGGERVGGVDGIGDGGECGDVAGDVKDSNAVSGDGPPRAAPETPPAGWSTLAAGRPPPAPLPGPISKKRPGQDPTSSTQSKKPRQENPPATSATSPPPTTPPPLPPGGDNSSSPILPQLPNPRAIYSLGTVTVLTSTTIPHPTHPGKKKRTVTTLVDAAEFWPTPPTASFSFTWDDMYYHYPPEMAGKTFTIAFDALYLALQTYFEGGVPDEDGFGQQTDGEGFVQSSESEKLEDLDAAEEIEWALKGPVSSETGESDGEYNGKG